METLLQQHWHTTDSAVAMRVLVLLLELLVLGFWHAAAVDVSDSAELLAALQSTAEEIVLLNDVAMGPEFEQFDNAPLVIRRCVVAVVAATHARGVYAGGVIRLIPLPLCCDACLVLSWHMFHACRITHHRGLLCGGAVLLLLRSVSATAGTSHSQVSMAAGPLLMTCQ